MSPTEAGVSALNDSRERPAGTIRITTHDHAATTVLWPTYGNFYAWEFVKDGRDLQVQVEGQRIFNTTPQILQAAQDGYGLAYLPEDLVLSYVAAGQLGRVLDDWCPTFPGYHLSYPSRRQSSPAFRLILDSLRVQA